MSPRVKSGRVTAVPNTGGPKIRVSEVTEGGERSSAMSYAEGLAHSSTSTKKGTSTKEAVLPAAESRSLGEYLSGSQHTTILEGQTRGDKRRWLADTTMALVAVEEMKIARCVENETILENSLMVDQEASWATRNHFVLLR